MTAVASTRQKNNNSTRRPAAPATDATVDYADVPVLLRLPNLDRPIGAPPLDAAVGAIDGEEVSPSTRTSGRTHRSDRPQPTTSGAETTRAKSTQATPKVLALLWRAGIVVAAIGLVVLAYRIINGPPQVEGDMYSDASEGDTSFTAPVVTMDQSTPAPSAAIAANLQTPTLATPKLATPLVSEYSHTARVDADSDVPALEGINPSAASEPSPTNYAARENTTPNWDDSPAIETGGAQARPWNESTVGRDDFAQPSDRDNQQRPWASSEQSQPTYADTSSPDTYRNFETASVPSYPETDPRTWRTPQQWDEAARYGEPTAEPGYDTWQENSRSAARLRPEIEQPPLRR